MDTKALAINAMVRRGPDVATFFDAKFRLSGDLYYSVHVGAEKEYVRASFHKSGDQILRDRPNDSVLHTDDVPRRGVHFYLKGAPELSALRGAAQLLVVMPRAEHLHWHPEASTTSTARRDVAWDADELPPLPEWCFRFGLIESGRDDLATSLDSAFGWMSAPLVVRDTSPWLFAGFARPDDELFRYWNDGTAAMGEPVGMFAHQPIQPGAPSRQYTTHVGWFAGSQGPRSAAAANERPVVDPLTTQRVTSSREEIAAQMGLTVDEFERQLDWSTRRPRILVIPGPHLASPFDVRTAKGWIVRCDECLVLPSRRLMTRAKAADAAARHNSAKHHGNGGIDVLGGPKFS